MCLSPNKSDETFLQVSGILERKVDFPSAVNYTDHIKTKIMQNTEIFFPMLSINSYSMTFKRCLRKVGINLPQMQTFQMDFLGDNVDSIICLHLVHIVVDFCCQFPSLTTFLISLLFILGFLIISLMKNMYLCMPEHDNCKYWTIFYQIKLLFWHMLTFSCLPCYSSFWFQHIKMPCLMFYTGQI